MPSNVRIQQTWIRATGSEIRMAWFLVMKTSARVLYFRNFLTGWWNLMNQNYWYEINNRYTQTSGFGGIYIITSLGTGAWVQPSLYWVHVAQSFEAPHQQSGGYRFEVKKKNKLSWVGSTKACAFQTRRMFKRQSRCTLIRSEKSSTEPRKHEKENEVGQRKNKVKKNMHEHQPKTTVEICI